VSAIALPQSLVTLDRVRAAAAARYLASRMGMARSHAVMRSAYVALRFDEGQFFGLHMIATDSRGYLYTGEVFAGQRVQRFVPADSPRGKLLDQLSRLE